MGGGVSDVVEEGAVGIGHRGLSNRFYGMIGECVCGVVVFWKRLHQLIVMPKFADASTFVFWIGLKRIEEIAAAIEESIILLEATMKRVSGFAVSQVPFS